MENSNSPFDLQYLSELLDRFVQEAPALLGSVPQTASLVARLEQFTEVADTPFTVAVVGQMRMGKSSLINALIGEDLAPVGVNETTATINYFRYAPPDQPPAIRVHWREKPPEDFLLAEIDRWCGQNIHARQTRFIEFFSPAELLKTLYIVDTPGTRSVIEGHKEIIDDFMAERRERETLACGGRADAIIYLVGPVARESDQRFLDQFGDQTRATRSSPFNSIAVLHKWETVDTADPLATAKVKAEKIAQQLVDHVSAVVPVSAPLMHVADRQSPAFWNLLGGLLRDTSRNLLERTVKMGLETQLEERVPPLFEAYQKAGLPWASFRALVTIAEQNGFPDGEHLRSLVDEAGGKAALMKALNDHFIRRSRLIKSFSLLDRALKVCREGRLRLGNRVRQLRSRDKEIQSIVEHLQPLQGRMLPAVDSALVLFKTIAKEIAEEADRASETLGRLDTSTLELETHFVDLEEDVRQLQALDTVGNALDDAELFELRCLLGCYGQSAKQRLSCYPEKGRALLTMIDQRIAFWSGATELAARSIAPVLGHAVDRLEALASYLEARSDFQ